jgi:chemotaxis family two-component system response regulator Rcp1
VNQKTSIFLMADDDNDDCIMAKDAMKAAASCAMIHCVEDGNELMDYLLDASSLPSLILLDLNMPRKDGRQALIEIKSIPSLQDIPIVIFTTTSEKKDIAFSRKMGADLFITKPDTFSEWVDIMKMLTQNYAQHHEEIVAGL